MLSIYTQSSGIEKEVNLASIKGQRSTLGSSWGPESVHVHILPKGNFETTDISPETCNEIGRRAIYNWMNENIFPVQIPKGTVDLHQYI